MLVLHYLVLLADNKPSWQATFRKGFLHFIGEGELGACHFPEFCVGKADTEHLSMSPDSTIGCGPFLRVLRFNVVSILCICLFLLIQIICEHINIEK